MLLVATYDAIFQIDFLRELYQSSVQSCCDIDHAIVKFRNVDIDSLKECYFLYI